MHTIGIHVNRPIDLSEVDSIGFDLDHTLAAYNDHALNQLAAAETAERLVRDFGYDAGPVHAYAAEPAAAARTLALDLRHGAILKLGADDRVLAARRDGEWLDAGAMEARFPAAVLEVDVWRIHSPFDLPVVWFFERMAAAIPGANLDTLMRDIRRALDLTHTRGRLKPTMARDLSRFVSPAGDIVALLERLRAAGKRLFVVTNSHRDYAQLVLERAVGDRWREYFGLVVVDANKPAFFSAPEQGVVAGGELVVEGVTASRLESHLGAGGARVLYMGDNVRADVSAAHGHGWRTGLVVAEPDNDADAWLSPFHHHGRSTAFLREVGTVPDVACDRVDRLCEFPLDRALDVPSQLVDRLAVRDGP